MPHINNLFDQLYRSCILEKKKNKQKKQTNNNIVLEMSRPKSSSYGTYIPVQFEELLFTFKEDIFTA